MSSAPPPRIPQDDARTNAGSMNRPLTIPYAFALGIGAGIGVCLVMEMMKWVRGSRSTGSASSAATHR